MVSKSLEEGLQLLTSGDLRVDLNTGVSRDPGLWELNSLVDRNAKRQLVYHVFEFHS